jgi:hypothetical protein
MEGMMKATGSATMLGAGGSLSNPGVEPDIKQCSLCSVFNHNTLHHSFNTTKNLHFNPKSAGGVCLILLNHTSLFQIFFPFFRRIPTILRFRSLRDPLVVSRHATGQSRWYLQTVQEGHIHIPQLAL